MTDAEEILQLVERTFGYPVMDPGLREFLLRAWAAEVEDCQFTEVLGFFLVRSVNWAAEGHRGEHPGELARAAQSARLEIDPSDEPLDVEAPEALARHLCGLLSVEVEYVRRVEEHWLADLNPRGKHHPAPIYWWSPSGYSDVPVFSSVADLLGWQGLLRMLERADGDDDKETLRRLGLAARDQHPGAFSLFSERLVKNGLLLDQPRVPEPISAHSDDAGDRLWTAYRAMIPVAQALGARAQGVRGATLSAAQLSACIRVATSGGDWPPALLLGFLAPALAGMPAEARALAQVVVDEKKGVPLTQRWATAVLDDSGPLAA